MSRAATSGCQRAATRPRISDALGYPRPVFVHFPVILGPDGGKLSKRHGAKSVLEYAADGYLPEAVFNFLAILGWAYDDKTELFTRERLIEVFELDRISVNPSTFDTQKLEWMNGVYLRDMRRAGTGRRDSRSARAATCRPSVPPPARPGADRRVHPATSASAMKLLSEVAGLVDFFFAHDVPTPAAAEFLAVKRWRDDAAGAAAGLEACATTLDALERLVGRRPSRRRCAQTADGIEREGRRPLHAVPARRDRQAHRAAAVRDDRDRGPRTGRRAPARGSRRAARLSSAARANGHPARVGFLDRRGGAFLDRKPREAVAEPPLVDDVARV